MKTRCTIHDDRETLEWFYDAFSKALISYHGMKLAIAIANEGITD